MGRWASERGSLHSEESESGAEKLISLPFNGAVVCMTVALVQSGELSIESPC